MLGQTTKTVTPQTGAYVNGVWVSSAGTPYNVRASVQPLSPRAVEMLPEGARTSARYVAFVRSPATIKTTDLTGSPATPADRITYQAREYVAYSHRDFSDHTSGLAHQEYVLIEVWADA